MSPVAGAAAGPLQAPVPRQPPGQPGQQSYPPAGCGLLNRRRRFHRRLIGGLRLIGRSAQSERLAPTYRSKRPAAPGSAPSDRRRSDRAPAPLRAARGSRRRSRRMSPSRSTTSSSSNGTATSFSPMPRKPPTPTTACVIVPSSLTIRSFMSPILSDFRILARIDRTADDRRSRTSVAPASEPLLRRPSSVAGSPPLRHLVRLRAAPPRSPAWPGRSAPGRSVIAPALINAAIAQLAINFRIIFISLCIASLVRNRSPMRDAARSVVAALVHRSTMHGEWRVFR